MQTINELQLREKLGIPSDARQIILFSESSHWDPNWLQTSEEYYTNFIQSNLDQAINLLEKTPHRKYSVECVFFLKMYWDRNPQKHEQIRRLMNNGQLWMTSSGVTTADTLLPTEEALMREFLIGQEWLREIGVSQEPETVYFTDSFGCTPFLPTLLNAAGFTRTAFTRIDGMYFAGCDFESAKNFPRVGSSAELLRETLKTQDFIWRDTNGAELLCHWNAFNYGQGDMLAARGITRMYMMPYFINDSSHRNVRNKINQFIKKLSPLAKTPYLFCPIGFDFVAPIDPLINVLDQYNKREYEKTGIWALNATLDDYLDLVNCYREQLPVVEALDPNPYWTGFYSSRPYLKKIAHQAADQLVLAERLAIIQENHEINQTLKELWWKTASSNHHDLITGTSPDRVMEAESYPWLEQVLIETNELNQVNPSQEKELVPVSEKIEWHLEENLFKISNKHYSIEIDPATGSLIRKIADDKVYPLPNSNDLILYADSGGLWRMGHEFKGGYLKEMHLASQEKVSYTIVENEDHLILQRKIKLKGETIQQNLIFYVDSPLVFGQIIGRAPEKSTITLRFYPQQAIDQLRMAQPGGLINRQPQKIYSPTYWPMQDFCCTLHDDEKTGIVFYTTQPTAAAVLESGAIELVVLRNAIHETAFGFLGIPANPAKGFEKQTCTFEYAFDITDSTAVDEKKMIRNVNRIKAKFLKQSPSEPAMQAIADQIQINSKSAIKVMAFKPAHRGEGFILRLRVYQPCDEPISIGFKDILPIKAFLCDARERDIHELAISNKMIQIQEGKPIITIRVLPDSPA